MLIKISSLRGHHEAEVETEVAEALFNKLSGRTKAPFPEEFKTKIPATFQELESLWEEGGGGFSLFTVNDKKEMIPVKKFNPEIKELCFLAPVAGG
jgi:hypothetical protein